MPHLLRPVPALVTLAALLAVGVASPGAAHEEREASFPDGTGSRPVDTRIVVATNRPLSGLVEERQFRPDLYYRLSGVDVRVPALRQRKEDIMELAHYFLSRHNTRHRITTV